MTDNSNPATDEQITAALGASRDDDAFTRTTPGDAASATPDKVDGRTEVV